jgi:hypothetical protein
MILIYLFSGFVLSSTNLYLDNCLYARNTIRDNDFFTTAGGGVPSVGGEESLFTALGA